MATQTKHPYRPDQPVRNSSGKQVATHRFRTLQQMCDALDWSIEDADNRPSKSSIKRETGRKTWTGTNTPEDYVDMLRNGWQHGVKNVEGLDGLSSDRAERLHFERNVGGVFPVVPAYLAGAPDAMLDVRPAPTDSVRGLTLVIDSSFHAGVDASTALKYAQSVMRLVAWLQSEQIDVSVYIVCPIQFDGKRFIYTTPIRESGQVLQPERIAAVVHPSWLRRAWFAMVEREYYEYDEKSCRSCTCGFGHVAHASADELRQVLPEAYSVIMLPKVGSGDPELAVKESISLKLRKE